MRYTQLNKLGVSTSLPNLLPKLFGLSLPILVCSETEAHSELGEGGGHNRGFGAKQAKGVGFYIKKHLF